jgi:hypothetical protein
MNLIIHQLRKDLLRTRWLILLWCLVLVLRFALVGANNDPSDNAWQITYQLLTTLTTLLDALLILVIVPLVIQQEPLLGTTAFWLTRPLSRSTLFASKTLFVSVLLILPIVVQSTVLLANGVTLREVALSIPWLLITQLCWIVSVAVVAVLTPSFGRFAIGMVIYLIILFVLTYIFQIARIFGNVNAFMATAPSLTDSRSLVSASWTIALGAIVLFAQYLWRKPILGGAFAVAALLGPIFIEQFWPWNFLKPPVNFVHADAIVPSALTLGLEKHVDAFDSASFRGGLPKKAVQGTIDFGGITDAGTIKISQVDSSLKTATGVPVPTTEPNQNTVFSSSLNRSALETALGVPLINTSVGRGGQQQMQLFTLENAEYLKVREQPLQYDGTAHGIIYKYASTAELPLQKGAEFRRGSQRLTLTGILHQPDGVDITAREQDVQLPLSLRSDQDVVETGLGRRGYVAYALVNRKLKQAVMEKQNNFGGMYRIFSSTGTPLIHTPLMIGFGPENNNDWPVPIDETWLKDAVLVRLEMVPVAPFTKSFSYAGLLLDENSIETRARLAAEVAPPPIADLDKIVLPPNADRKQVSDYISAILDASRQQNTWSDSDPEIQMLEQVGAENVDLLIEAAAENHNYYLNHAINDLAQPDQEKLVFRALPGNHDLINTVIRHRWQQDARPLLVAALPTAVNSLPNRWIDTVASFHDPATYPALRDYYVGHPHRAAYEALAKIPDFDLRGAVHAAWKLINDPTRAWATRNLLEPAAEMGEPDFPDVATQLLENRNQYDHQFAAKALRAFTPATGATDSDLLDWMKTNRANLVFEPTLKKFVLRAPKSTTMSPAPGPSLPAPPANNSSVSSPQPSFPAASSPPSSVPSSAIPPPATH